MLTFIYLVLIGMVGCIIVLTYHIYRIKHAKHLLPLKEMGVFINKYKQRFEDIQTKKSLLNNYEETLKQREGSEQEYENRKHLSFGYSYSLHEQRFNNFIDRLSLLVPTRRLYNLSIYGPYDKPLLFGQIILTPLKIYILELRNYNFKTLSVEVDGNWMGTTKNEECHLVEPPLEKAKEAIERIRHCFRHTPYHDIEIEYVVVFPKTLKILGHSPIRLVHQSNLHHLFNTKAEEPSSQLNIKELNLLWVQLISESQKCPVFKSKSTEETDKPQFSRTSKKENEKTDEENPKTEEALPNANSISIDEVSVTSDDKK